MLYLSLRAGQGGGEGGGRRSRPGDTPARQTLPGAAHGRPADTPRGPGGGPDPGTRDAAPTRARPPRCRPARGAQFPETQIPERTPPRIHGVHERTALFTRGQSRAHTLLGGTPALARACTHGPPADSCTQGRGTLVESQVSGKESQTDTPVPPPYPSPTRLA